MKKLWHFCLLMIAFLMITLILSLIGCRGKNGENDTTPPAFYNNPSDATSASDGPPSDANNMIAAFAQQHHLQAEAWPDDLVAFLEKNPEAKDFVLNYPLKKNLDPTIDLSEYTNGDSVPLFMQWDERWGYNPYAGELMGLSGCGPTCLSMVCIYLLKDAKYSPEYVANFAERNGYSVSGNGSAWTLISSGGKELGLNVTEIPLDENRIIRNLEAGNPIICVMGPGDFTTTGHFIVMTQCVDGKIKVNDPNSKARSEILWELSGITDQIRNLWVCQK